MNVLWTKSVVNLRIPAQSTEVARCRWAVLVLVGLLALVWAARPAHAGCLQQVDQEIDGLIEQLDDDDFRLRESAEGRLVELGESLDVKQLALKLLNCSPETCYRLKRTLLQVAKNADERRLFKILAVLKTRFDIGDDLTLPLLEHWAMTRRQAVIQRWRDSGANVDDPYAQMYRRAGAAAPQFFNAVRPRQLDNFRVVIDGPVPRVKFEDTIQGSRRQKQDESTAGPDTAATSESQAPRPLSLQRQIEQVIANTLDQDIQHVLGERSASAEFHSALAVLQAFPVTLRLDDTWKGDIADFARDASAQSLPISAIQLKSLKLDVRWGEVLQQHPLDACSLSDCVLAEDVDRRSPLLPASVKTLAIENSTDTGKFIDRLVVDRSNVFRVNLINCPLDMAVAKTLQAMDLTALSLENLDLKQDDFDRLKTLPKLRQLNLNRCRFGKEAFKAFERSLAGRVRVEFTAKAFLGVRGMQSRLGFGPGPDLGPADEKEEAATCVITEVISGSAADDAGVEAGDIILGIGEQAIGDFSDLRVLIAQYGAGDQIVIRVRRDGQERELKTTLGESNADQFRR